MSKFDYTSIEPGYYDEVFHRSRGVQSRWHHHKFEVIKRCLPARGKVLDIGCGPGTFIGSLSTSHPELNCIGIDFSEPQVKYARSTYGRSNFECIDVYDDNFDSTSDSLYDAITIIEVIEHIQKSDAVNMLKRAKDLLKRDGKLVLTTPNYHSSWGLVEIIVNAVGEVSYKDQHINKYSSARLYADLSEAGFTDIRVRSFLSFSPFLAAVSWRASKFLSIGECYSGALRPAGMLLIAEAKVSSEVGN